MAGKLYGSENDALHDEASDESVPVVLHPLVVMNISDHFTRFAAMGMFPEATARNAASDGTAAAHTLTDASGRTRVLGILLGTQNGRTVEVCHSFELRATITEKRQTEVDVEFMERRIHQYKQIFAQYNVVGWYCTGSEVSAEDLRLHSDVFSVLNEAPILLVMNPTSSTGNSRQMKDVASSSVQPQAEPKSQGHVPGVLVAYQVELRVVNDMPKMILAPVPHRYASADSERIAVNHVMRHAIPGGGDGASSTALHLGTLRRSINMLKSRMRLLVAFLEAMTNGQVEVDHALLRKVAGVCARLPAMDCEEFSQAFAEEHDDSLVVTYLSGVTKSLCALNEAVDMFNRFNERPGGGIARRRGTFSHP